MRTPSFFSFLILLSSAALSNFNYVEKLCGEGPSCKGLDASFSKIVQEITSKDTEPRAIFIPKGRSLQAKKNGTDFKDPRIVSASNDGGFFMGYSKRKKQIEIIQRNPQTGENEFFLISNYPNNPRIEKQNKDSKCFDCHKGGELLFSNGPWDETTANPWVAFEMCLAMKNHETGKYTNTYEGLRFTDDCEALESLLLGNPLARNSLSDAFADATAFDESVRQNQKTRFFENYLCDFLCDQHKTPKSCKREMMSLMLLDLGNNFITPINTNPVNLEKFYKKITLEAIEEREIPKRQKKLVVKRLRESLDLINSKNFSEQGREKLFERRFTSVLADMAPETPLLENFLKKNLSKDAFRKFQKEYKRRRSPALLIKDNNEQATFDPSFAVFFPDFEAGLMPESSNPHLGLGEAHFFEHDYRRLEDLKGSDRFEITKYDLTHPMQDLYQYGPIPENIFADFTSLNINACIGSFEDLDLNLKKYYCRDKLAEIYSNESSEIYKKYFSEFEIIPWNFENRKKITQKFKEFIKTECPDETLQRDSSSKKTPH